MKIIENDHGQSRQRATGIWNVEAVLWDMDGTLVDSEPLHEASLIETLVAQGIVPPADLNKMVVGLSTLKIYQMFTEQFGLKQDYHAWCEARQVHYLGRATELQPRQGAMELFLALHSRGIKQGIVSNSDRMILTANMKVLGLTRPNQVSISKNDVIEGKPSPEGYLRAALLLGVMPSRTLVIEDSVTGALAGIAAEMSTAYVPQSCAFTCPSPAMEFKHFQELSSRLRAHGIL